MLAAPMFGFEGGMGRLVDRAFADEELEPELEYEARDPEAGEVG